MDLKSLDRRLDRAAAAAQPRPARPHRRTTAEGRQELDRILQTIANPRPPTPAELLANTEAYAELDLVIARLEPSGAHIEAMVRA
jgi:hypothetical protein